MPHIQRHLLPLSVRPPSGDSRSGAVILCDTITFRVMRWVELFRLAGLNTTIIASGETSSLVIDTAREIYKAKVIHRNNHSSDAPLDNLRSSYGLSSELFKSTHNEVSPHFKWIVDNSIWINGTFVVAVGISNLPPAVIVGAATNKKIIYDVETLNYIPGQECNGSEKLKEEVQKNLITEVDIVTATNYSLCSTLSELYPIPIPSVVWDIAALSLRSHYFAAISLRDLLQLNNADSKVFLLPCTKDFPSKEKIDLVLQAWTHISNQAKLVIYGSFEDGYCDYLKVQAAEKGLLNTAVSIIERPLYPQEALSAEGFYGCILPDNPVDQLCKFKASFIFDLLLQGLPVLATAAIDYQLIFGSLSRAVCQPMNNIDEVVQSVKRFFSLRDLTSPICHTSAWELPSWIHDSNNDRSHLISSIQDMRKLKEELLSTNPVEISNKVKELLTTLTQRALATLSGAPEL